MHCTIHNSTLQTLECWITKQSSTSSRHISCPKNPFLTLSLKALHVSFMSQQGCRLKKSPNCFSGNKWWCCKKIIQFRKIIQFIKKLPYIGHPQQPYPWIVPSIFHHLQPCIINSKTCRNLGGGGFLGSTYSTLAFGLAVCGCRNSFKIQINQTSETCNSFYQEQIQQNRKQNLRKRKLIQHPECAFHKQNIFQTFNIRKDLNRHIDRRHLFSFLCNLELHDYDY